MYTPVDLAETLAAINRRLEQMDIRFNERFDQIDERFNQVNERFDRVEGLLANVCALAHNNRILARNNYTKAYHSLQPLQKTVGLLSLPGFCHLFPQLTFRFPDMDCNWLT